MDSLLKSLKRQTLLINLIFSQLFNLVSIALMSKSFSRTKDIPKDMTRSKSFNFTNFQLYQQTNTICLNFQKHFEDMLII